MRLHAVTDSHCFYLTMHSDPEQTVEYSYNPCINNNNNDNKVNRQHDVANTLQFHTSSWNRLVIKHYNINTTSVDLNSLER